MIMMMMSWMIQHKEQNQVNYLKTAIDVRRETVTLLEATFFHVSISFLLPAILFVCSFPLFLCLFYLAQFFNYMLHTNKVITQCDTGSSFVNQTWLQWCAKLKIEKQTNIPRRYCSSDDELEEWLNKYVKDEIKRSFEMALLMI